MAYPCEQTALTGVIEAAEARLIAPILVGPRQKICEVAREAGLNLDPYPIEDVPDAHAAAAKAVELVRSARAEALMKGSLHTDELMSAVVSSATGLRTGRRISHAFVMSVPTYPKPLVVTDAAINIAPTLEDKRDICQNAIDLAHSLGRPMPKVAILSAVETVTTKIPSTIDAAALCKMADRGQITGALLDGPLAMDNAISLEAAKTKGIASPVAGDADILVAPDLEAGNILAKLLTFLANADAAGLVLGAGADHPHQPCRQRADTHGILRSRPAGCPRPAQPVKSTGNRHEQLSPGEQAMSDVPSPPLLGKKALVLGIANEHSIAYGCAWAFRKLGADLAITYLNDKAKPLRRAAGAAVGGVHLCPAQRAAGRADGSRFRACPADMGPPRYCPSCDRVCPQGRPARQGCSTARRPVSGWPWTCRATRSCAWPAWRRR